MGTIVSPFHRWGDWRWVAEYLAEVIHQVCGRAQIWAQGGGARALIITHYTIPPLGHPDGVLPPRTLLWGQKLQWLQRASDTPTLAREPGRSDLLQAQGHHWAQFSACELQNQSYEASTVQDKSLKPSSVRTLLLWWAGHFSSLSLNVLIFKMGRTPQLWTELCPSKICMLKSWPSM